MNMELEQLMTVRHEAYQKALATAFLDASLTAAWRDANRAYVLARDGKHPGGRPKLQISKSARVERRRQQVREAVKRHRELSQTAPCNQKPYQKPA